MDFTVRPGFMRRRDDFAAVTVDWIEGKTGEVRDFVTSENQEWFLEAKVGVRFWANTDQYPRAREIAERVIMAQIYEDMHVELRNMRLAISNGDRLEAFAVVDRMQRIIEG